MGTARSSSRLLGGGFCLSACWDTPLGLGLDTPPGMGLETPQPDPSTSPLDVGLETPPWTEFLTHASENITLRQLRSGR